MEAFDYMFKLVLLGSSGVGKSQILLRFTKGQFSQDSQTTIGVQYATKTLQTQTDYKKKIKFQIWDTAGQQQYRALMKTFYKGASAAILTYDITSDKTFNDLQYWYKQIRQYCKSEIVIMLVGNKTDLDQLRKVSKQDGLSFAEKNRVAFYQVSAKTGANIDLIFGKIAQQLQKIMIEGEKAKQIQDNPKNLVVNPKPVQPQQQPGLKIKNPVQKKQKQGGGCCKK